MRVAIYTLGCKVNQYETQAMEQELLRRGHTLVPAETEADGYIVNTCSVTAISDKKSRQMIRRCHKLNPNAVVAACGCYVQTHPEVVAALDVDLLAGTGDRMAFLDLFEQAAHEKEPVRLLDDALRRREFEVLPAGGMAERTRAMLKVEDGCVNFCTYCIIPYARGPVRSLPLATAVAQTEQLRREGYRELVLTGIEISSWGHDLKNGQSLIDLLEAVSAAAGDMRLRLGSLEPRTISEDFCRRAAELLRKRKSRRAILDDLHAKGIDRGAAAEAVEALFAQSEEDEEENPELANARALVERHYAAKLAQGKWQQVAAALARRGFSHSVIRQALADAETEETEA